METPSHELVPVHVTVSGRLIPQGRDQEVPESRSLPELFQALGKFAMENASQYGKRDIINRIINLTGWNSKEIEELAQRIKNEGYEVLEELQKPHVPVSVIRENLTAILRCEQLGDQRTAFRKTKQAAQDLGKKWKPEDINNMLGIIREYGFEAFESIFEVTGSIPLVRSDILKRVNAILHPQPLFTDRIRGKASPEKTPETIVKTS